MIIQLWFQQLGCCRVLVFALFFILPLINLIINKYVNLVRNVLNNSFLWHVFSVSLVCDLRNVFSLVFHCIIVHNFFLNWNIFSVCLSLVFSFITLLRNVLNSWFSCRLLNNLLLNNRLLNNLLLNNRLLNNCRSNDWLCKGSS